METKSNDLLREREALQANGEQEQGGLNPMIYVFKLLYFWPYLMLALVVGLAGAFIYNRYATPEYKVNASLLINESKGGGASTKNLDAALLSGGLGGMTSTTDNEIGIIQSFTLVDMALKGLDLGVRITKLGQFSRQEVYPQRDWVVEVDSFHPQLVDLTVLIETVGQNRYRIVENGKEGHRYQPLRYDYEGQDTEPAEVASDIRTGTYAFGQWVQG
ncbi:MAG: hypothetical protein RIS78_815, partial [Bacteroidota bacterium]